MPQALVTGGAQGIGRAIAQRLLHDGYDVTITDLDDEAGQEAVADTDGRLRFVQADAGRPQDVRRVVESLPTLDVLVNNAGISVFRPFDALSVEEWHRVIDTNLTSIFLFTQTALSRLREARGRVVNVASTRALQSEANTEAYAASKGGVVAITHSLAVTLGPEVRVNCISPGWIDVSGWKKRSARHPEALRPIDHQQHPAGRVGRPEDIAALAAFLVSEEAGFITGANFVVDGGMTRRMIYAD